MSHLSARESMMATVNFDKDLLKSALKEALAETLNEQRDLLRDVFAEVLEDYAVSAAIREGRQTSIVSREEVFRVLRDKP
jgi:hypothetical protein